MKHRKYICLLFIMMLLASIPTSSTFADPTSPPIILNVGVDPSLPPFQFEEDGELMGFNIDILNHIAAKNHIQINYIRLNKELSIESLLDGRVDLVLGLRYDPSLTDKIYYTESVVQSVVCMLARTEDSKEIQSHLNSSYYIASVENDSVELNFLENVRLVNFNVAFNQEDAFELLLMDRADFLLGVKDTAEYLLDKYELTKEYTIIDSYTTPIEYSIAVKGENRNLYNLLNKGISQLKLSGEYENLYLKWVDNGEANIARRLKSIIRISFIGLIVGLFILCMGIVWNMQLKQQVKLKTLELSKSNLDLEAQIIETRNNNELKDLICESSPRGIAIFDVAGVISIFNSTALAMAELKEPPIGESIFNIEPMNLMLKGSMDMVVRESKGYICDQFKYIRGKKEFIYRYVMYPLNDYEKKLRGVIITIEDITQECKLKEQIMERDKNRTLTQIISGISHEIRNPLTTIKTFIELLPKKIDNQKFKEEIALVVPEEIERVNNLIESLIDYAKPKSQNKTGFQLDEIASAYLTLFKPVLEQNNIDHENHIQGSMYVYGDKSQIKQGIINFILNAIDAIKERAETIHDSSYQGRIIIDGFREENCVKLFIRDNGIGMDKEELERAYEIFYTTKEKGTGLGLPLSIQMLEMNNCRVSIESRKHEYTEITLVFGSEFI
ncbi:transporter substrate-binding domain-containing protein [Anaerosolibacter sp.]|uniref:transporter substrate-binding domain-containing protein n=1 Tax=Anaerosolibacter sp. TaxID=1872527 RepID=UPI0026070920|nr:transporter substrate-binding domain-containing protein [Anaerosolibacter sp.]